jgi:hypothetical protein
MQSTAKKLRNVKVRIGASAPVLVVPETFEAILRQRSVSRGVLYIAMPKVGLQRASIAAIVRTQREPATMH